MATQDKNLNEAVKVRKISKDEFKKTYFQDLLRKTHFPQMI